MAFLFLAVTNMQYVPSVRVFYSSAVEVTAGVCSAATARVGKEVPRSSLLLTVLRSGQRLFRVGSLYSVYCTITVYLFTVHCLTVV